MSLVDTSWKRICAWIDENAPGLLDSAQPGATPDEIAKLATRTGLTIPDDLREFVALVNGADDAGIFPTRDDFDAMAYYPLDIDMMIGDRLMLNDLLSMGEFADLEAEPSDGVAADWWNPGWIPFAGNGGGDYFCIDTVPAAGGKPGQIIAHSHESGERRKLADSLGEFLEQLADDMDSGGIQYDEDCGLVAFFDEN